MIPAHGTGASPRHPMSSGVTPSASQANLADILERVLDKGIVIAGDIRVNLLDIELLTIKIRLIVASVDRAREMGIDWWEHDPSLSSGGRRIAERQHAAEMPEMAAQQPAEVITGPVIDSPVIDSPVIDSPVIDSPVRADDG